MKYNIIDPFITYDAKNIFIKTINHQEISILLNVWKFLSTSEINIAGYSSNDNLIFSDIVKTIQLLTKHRLEYEYLIINGTDSTLYKIIYKLPKEKNSDSILQQIYFDNVDKYSKLLVNNKSLLNIKLNFFNFPILLLLFFFFL